MQNGDTQFVCPRLRIAPDLHKQVAIAASQHGMSLNRFVAEALSQAVNQS